MYRTADIFIQGGEVDDKPELSALLRHKARRGAKLRLLLGLHFPDHALRLQLTYQAPSLGLDM